MARSELDPDFRVDEYRATLRRPLVIPGRVFIACALFLVFSGGVFIARLGTDFWRIFGGVFILCLWAVAIEALRRNRRDWAQPGRALLRALRPVNAEAAGRVVRAHSLWKRTVHNNEGESAELAEHHLQRSMDEVPLSLVARAAAQLRARLVMGAMFLAVSCGFLLLFGSLALLEGMSVLSARWGVGSFPIAYVESMAVTVDPPSYLDGSGKKLFIGAQLKAIPVGSTLEVHIVPRVAGRRLFLTDGLKEVPFVSDGQGAFVAQWVVEVELELRVGARFGSVIVYDALKAHLTPISDLPPLVLLEGSGNEVSLADFTSLPLSYRVLDDHGISQVDLVLRSGQQTERKELVRLGGLERTYRAAHTLTRDHDLIQRAFLPVRVSIEARDENTTGGPSWGKSGTITLVPEPLGHEEAQRHLALRKFRESVSGYLAADLGAARLSARQADEARKIARVELRKAAETLRIELARGANPPMSSLSFIDAQLEAVEQKKGERVSPESVLLAIDALIQDISEREATHLAKNLGAAVEEVAVQIRQIRINSDAIDPKGLDDLLGAVELGAAGLREVGRLGLDLGSVARGDLARVKRNLKEQAYDRAEGAALHLAERLKRATPSFSSSGGAGVESGAPSSGSGKGSPQKSGEGASDAPSQFEEMSQNIDQLAQETAAELSQLEKMLRDAKKAAKADFETTPSLDEAKKAFEQAVQQLPSRSPGPGGPMAEAATGRRQGEAMIDALDSGDLSEAVLRGLDAEAALQRARQSEMSSPSWFNPDAVRQAQLALAELLKEAEKAAKALENKQQSGMDKSLSERGMKQREFAERARTLSKGGKGTEAPLAQEGIEALKRAAELLEKAAQEMDAGRAESGTEYAGRAQSELERALPQGHEARGQEGERAESDSNDGKGKARGSVPEKEKDRASEFRRRVEAGLGREGGGLSPAIRRYAEELK